MLVYQRVLRTTVLFWNTRLIKLTQAEGHVFQLEFPSTIPMAYSYLCKALTDPLVQVWSLPQKWQSNLKHEQSFTKPCLSVLGMIIIIGIPIIHWNWYPIGDWTPLPRLDSALGRWAGREAALVRLGFSMFFLGPRVGGMSIWRFVSHCDIRPMAGIVRNSPMRSFKEPLNKRSVVWRPPGGPGSLRQCQFGTFLVWTVGG